jgi:hypothetical protein
MLSPEMRTKKSAALLVIAADVPQPPCDIHACNTRVRLDADDSARDPLLQR